jgi:hypothetical protein
MARCRTSSLLQGVFTPLEDYELTRRDRQWQRSLQEIQEHARREAANMPPLPDEVLEKVAMPLSQATPDSQIMRWCMRLFCGHIIQARRHYTMTRPTDHGSSSQRCPECGMDPAAIVAYEPLGLAAEPTAAPAAPRSRARSSVSKAELQEENARLREELRRLRARLPEPSGPT